MEWTKQCRSWCNKTFFFFYLQVWESDIIHSENHSDFVKFIPKYSDCHVLEELLQNSFLSLRSFCVAVSVKEPQHTFHFVPWDWVLLSRFWYYGFVGMIETPEDSCVCKWWITEKRLWRRRCGEYSPWRITVGYTWGEMHVRVIQHKDTSLRRSGKHIQKRRCGRVIFFWKTWGRTVWCCPSSHDMRKQTRFSISTSLQNRLIST